MLQCIFVIKVYLKHILVCIYIEAAVPFISRIRLVITRSVSRSGPSTLGAE